MFGDGQGRARQLRRLGAIVMVIGGGGAAVAAAGTASSESAGGAGARASRASTRVVNTGYATTPTSSGAINPSAVPLGDGYVSTTPKVGYVDSCTTQFGLGGASVNGPWINERNKTWDYRTKLSVNGAIKWPSGSYKVRIADGRRVIKFNDLPIDHTTGRFPISSSDAAYSYDRNPNHIAAQSFDWSLSEHPKLAGHASCVSMGPIGVLDDGVVLYNALDGGGRDAAAHEVLDICAGHPDQSSTYHHHDVPPCILNKTPNGRSTLVGYALDGYGIYVKKSSNGTLPTNRQLDRCHGTTSRVMWNGKMTRIYHYVATLEYPYTVGCFRGTPISSGHQLGATGGAPSVVSAPTGAGAPATAGATQP